MVDSVSGKNLNAVQDAGLQSIGSQEKVERINQNAAKEASNVSSLKSVDNATISDEAKQAYEQEKEILKFSRLAMRVKESFDGDKVSRLKDMVNSGKINDYLRNLNTDTLADSLLNSPSGAFLR